MRPTPLTETRPDTGADAAPYASAPAGRAALKVTVGASAFARTHGSAATGAASPASLALFLILLGFFIVMTATSEFETGRVSAVSESVTRAFKISSGTLNEPPPGLLLRAGAGREVYLKLAEIVAPSLPSDQLTILPSGTEMQALIPAALLFGRNGAAVRDPFPLLDELVTLVSAPPDGLTITLSVFAPASDTLSGTATDDLNPDVARLGMLARALTARGMPRKFLAIGLEPASSAAADTPQPATTPDTPPRYRFVFHVTGHGTPDTEALP